MRRHQKRFDSSARQWRSLTLLPAQPDELATRLIRSDRMRQLQVPTKGVRELGLSRRTAVGLK